MDAKRQNRGTSDYHVSNGNGMANSSVPPISRETSSRRRFFASLKQEMQLNKVRKPPPKYIQDMETGPSVPARADTVPSLPSNIPDSYKLAANTMKYTKGALILLRLVNFQIATDSTYRFEPHLNLILGGNGTGKSAIINAIYLLFLGNLADLKQKFYSNFVQHGKQHAEVSALLQGSAGLYNGTNPVVSMVVSSTPTSGRHKYIPQWFINGEEVGVLAVWDLVCELNIQVNNLCQFLPQFRVAAFSGETAQQRLISTEEAIGYPGMVEDHRLLSVSGEELSELNAEIKALEPEIEQLADRQTHLIDLREKIMEARKNQQNVETLEKVVDLARYYEIEKEIDHIKEKNAKAKSDLQEFDVKSVRYQSIIDAAKTESRQLLEQRNRLTPETEQNKTQFRQFVDHIRRERGYIEDHLTRIHEAKLIISSKRRDYEALKDSYNDVQMSIKSLRDRLMENNTTTDEFNKKEQILARLEGELKQLTNHQSAVISNLERLESSITQANFRIQEHNKKLVQLEQKTRTRSTAEVRKLIRNDNGSIEACCDFLGQNSDKFQQPIILPAVLSLNITDNRMALPFASLVSEPVVQKFVCQTPEDQRTVNRMTANSRDMRLMTVLTKRQDGRSVFESRRDWLKSLGFEGVVTDVLKAPPAMMSFMMSQGLHNVPYTFDNLKPNAAQELETFFMNSRMNALRYVDRGCVYTLSRSKFGRRTVTTVVSNFRKYAPWATFMIQLDTTSQQNSIKQSIEQTKAVIANRTADIEQARAEETELTAKVESLRDQEQELHAELRQERQWRSKLKVEEREKRKISEKMQLLENVLRIKPQELKRMVVELKRLIANLRDSVPPHPTNLLSQITSMQFTQEKISSLSSDRENYASALSSHMKDERELIVYRIAETQRAIDEFNAATRDLYTRYEEATVWLRQRRLLSSSVEKAKSTPLTELETEYKRQSAALALTEKAESLESVEGKLESTTTQLTELRKQFSNHNSRLSSLNGEIMQIRTRWQQGLDRMIPQVSRRFSDMFRQANCYGNVTLFRDDELAVGTWGIDINVSFRNGEPPVKLSRQRQSGGERAITTAFYLLALQDQAHAPFRVLDEINQGMDEQNERITMKFLVDFSCNTSSRAQQYFIVTPKLIPNMHTHPRMNVVFIMGGTAVGDSKRVIPSYDNKSRIKRLRQVATDSPIA